MVGRSWVNQDTSHKWGNRAYVLHTLNRKYLPYAFGGGYILSLDVVQVRPGACRCLHAYKLENSRACAILASYAAQQLHINNIAQILNVSSSKRSSRPMSSHVASSCRWVESHTIMQVLLALQRTAPHGLLFTRIEDANMGMWLAGMAVHRINWPGSMLAGGWTCCFARASQCAPLAIWVCSPHFDSFRGTIAYRVCSHVLHMLFGTAVPDASQCFAKQVSYCSQSAFVTQQLARRNDRNPVLGRYTLSADPCQAAPVRRSAHRDTIAELRAQSAQAQAEVAGHNSEVSLESDRDDATQQHQARHRQLAESLPDAQDCGAREACDERDGDADIALQSRVRSLQDSYISVLGEDKNTARSFVAVQRGNMTLPPDNPEGVVAYQDMVTRRRKSDGRKFAVRFSLSAWHSKTLIFLCDWLACTCKQASMPSASATPNRVSFMHCLRRACTVAIQSVREHDSPCSHDAVRVNTSAKALNM